MRVLVVTTSYPSARAPHNGVFIREHAKALIERGYEVCVLAPRVFRDDPKVAEEDGVSVRRFGFWSGQRLLTEYERTPVLRMGTYLAGGVAACAALLRSFRPDVVHAHWAIPAGLIAVVAAAVATRTPVVTSVHGADLRLAQSGPRIAGRLFSFTLRRSASVSVVSRAQREELVRALGRVPDPLDIVPMGVDTRVFAPGDRDAARLRLGVMPDARMVLFVGGLTALKGVRELIEAAPRILPSDDTVRVVLAGVGPLDEELRERARTLGLGERVVLLGAVEHDGVPDWITASDVLVLPSFAEGLPVCLMEAAACGVPVVASDVGGCSEITSLDPRSALVRPGDVEALASAIESVLRLPSNERRSVLEEGSPFTLDGAMMLLGARYETLVGETTGDVAP